METIKDRIKQIVNDKTDGNYSEFCRETKLSNGFIHSISEHVQEKTVRKILRAYPDLNESWLRDGSGQMYTKKPEISDDFYKEIIRELMEQVNFKDRVIEEKDMQIKEFIREVWKMEKAGV